jgi:hypothetical protein
MGTQGQSGLHTEFQANLRHIAKSQEKEAFAGVGKALF